jgi:purine-binding chemotaxis protein CheW
MQDAHDFVAFRVQEQEFCLPVTAVREIRSATRIVPLPNVTEEFKGLMNLRGVVLPVVDMTKRLGLPVSERSPQPVIIVAESAGRLIGLDVDAVDDIISAHDAELQPVPGVQGGNVNQFVRGILNKQGRLLCILDLNKLLPAVVEEVG